MTDAEATPRQKSSRLRWDDSKTYIPEPRPERHEETSHQTPPAQPPSLTLSIFTMPSHLSFSRVFAVMSINLVLPFINGVMLGFGEIFAREVVKVSRSWWREGGSVFRSSERRDPDRSFGGGRGVAGVGLSAGGGFP